VGKCDCAVLHEWYRYRIGLGRGDGIISGHSWLDSASLTYSILLRRNHDSHKDLDT
jgi:hypothetical protein